MFIAKRYLISKKSFNIINIISGISILGITIGTMALIVILSVFNGFEDLITSLYHSYNPDIKITAERGKTFHPEEASIDSLRALEGVVYLTEVIEDNALLKYGRRQHIVTLKGVRPDYGKAKDLDTLIIDGQFMLEEDGSPFAVLGAGVAYYVGLYLGDHLKPFSVYAPSRTGSFAGVGMEGAFNRKSIYPSAILSLHQEFDVNYVLVPLSLARELFEYPEEITAIELDVGSGEDLAAIQKKAAAIAGAEFTVRNRFQQQALLYKIMRSEKWAIFLILTFILIIATFNMIGSLTMLIIDKKKDVAVLHSMGASARLIRRIFLAEGMLISLLGALAGLILGLLLSWMQVRFGLVSLGGGTGSFIVEHYPVKIQWTDCVYVFFTVVSIGFLSSLIPVRQISRKYIHSRLQ